MRIVEGVAADVLLGLGFIVISSGFAPEGLTVGALVSFARDDVGVVEGVASRMILLTVKDKLTLSL